MKKALYEKQNKWTAQKVAAKKALKAAKAPGAGLAAALTISTLQKEISLCEEFINDLQELIDSL